MQIVTFANFIEIFQLSLMLYRSNPLNHDIIKLWMSSWHYHIYTVNKITKFRCKNFMSFVLFLVVLIDDGQVVRVPLALCVVLLEYVQAFFDLFRLCPPPPAWWAHIICTLYQERHVLKTVTLRNTKSPPQTHVPYFYIMIYYVMTRAL